MSQATVLHNVMAAGGSCPSLGVAVHHGRVGRQLLWGGQGRVYSRPKRHCFDAIKKLKFN